MNKKKIIGASVTVAVVALIATGAVYLSKDWSYSVVDTPENPNTEVVEEIDTPVESGAETESEVELDTDQKVENIKVHEDGTVTAIVDGEAFADGIGSNDISGYTLTEEEKIIYENAKKKGLPDEVILSTIRDTAELLSDIPDTTDSDTDTSDNDSASTNNEDNDLLSSSNKTPVDKPEKEPNNNNTSTNSGKVNNDKGNSSTSGGKKDTQKYDEYGNPIWTPPEGFKPAGDTRPSKEEEIPEGAGDATVPEEDKHIKFY